MFSIPTSSALAGLYWLLYGPLKYPPRGTKFSLLFFDCAASSAWNDLPSVYIPWVLKQQLKCEHFWEPSTGFPGQLLFICKLTEPFVLKIISMKHISNIWLAFIYMANAVISSYNHVNSTHELQVPTNARSLTKLCL